MNPTAEDVKDLLVAASSAIGLDFGIDLFCFLQPDEPDLCATIKDSGGFDPDPQFRYDRPTIQVLVRGNRNEYQEAYTVAETIKEFLRQTADETVNGTRYVGFWVLADIFPLGWDEKGRPEFTINFRVHRTE